MGSIVGCLVVIVAGAAALGVGLTGSSDSNPPATPASSSQSTVPSPGTGLTAAGRSAVAAASRYAVQFATYDYRHLAADFAKTEANSVAPFRQQYQQRVAGRLAHVLRNAKSRSTAKVVSAGLVSLTSSTAVVDVFLNQTIVNKHTARPRLDPQRIVMTLRRVGSQWKISRVLLP